MCFKPVFISTLRGKLLKLADLFTYLSSNISSTESDVYIRLAKVLSAIYKLSILWKSELSQKIKRDFFQAVTVSVLLYGCTNVDANENNGEKARWDLYKNVTCCFEQMLEATTNKIAVVRLHISHLTNYPNKTKKDKQGTAGKVRRNSKETFSDWLLHKNAPALANQ